ncbi:hypothetical protein G7045_10290 [Acidovorax sp. HDW3]|uniref:hypothetical protein n=1 Tax=Acidovorax sp. HDW3 TaxID=2714923 RepID=UPI0014082CB1|nr:hypothetical protein [Acidovorax sp. HDW3]QIL44620.1 hypothetical protein G7045_10290 [Acidovorax sp. HDW3]
MNAKRTEPRVHCYARPLAGGYVSAARSTTEHLQAVFAAERERLALAARPRRQRRPRIDRAAQLPAPGQMLLVA